MIPLYLAEMKKLKETDPDIWTQFVNGNWVVNKKCNPFCAIGADHALEHINRWLKVSGGIVGITLNENARNRFFLVSPHFTHITEEAHKMAGMTSTELTRHHDLTKAASHRQERNVNALKKNIATFLNPFQYEGNDVINIVTKAVMSEKIKSDIISLTETGQKSLDVFVEERIKSKTLNFWDPIKKQKLKLRKDNAKLVQIKTKDKVVELRADRSLFARMLIVARSRPDIDLKLCLGTYELSVVPMSMFSADGSLLRICK